MSSSSTPASVASSFLTSTTLGIGIGLASAYVAQAVFPGLSLRGAATTTASAAAGAGVKGPSNGRSVSMAMTEDLMGSSSPRFELPLPLRSTRKNPPLSVSALTNKQNLEHLDIDGKRVLMRVDYNVKVKNGVVQDRSRIDGTIPTLKHLLSVRGPKGGVKCIVLITHLGRPTGPDSVEYSLEPVARCLQHDYFPSTPVRFLPDCVGAEIEREIAMCEPGTIFVCENLRFHAEETGIRLTPVTTPSGVTMQKERVPFADKVRFREGLSRLGDVFVFEAFGAAHRPHSSIIGIDLPQRAAGLLMAKEMSYYSRVLGEPARPFLAIVGGSKVSDKILVLENLLNIVDEMIIGGGMAYTFLKVLRDVRIGKSLYDEPGAKLVHRIMAKAADRNVRIHLPDDHIIGDRFSNDAKIGVTSNEEGIPDTWMGLDIGPRSRLVNSEVMQRAKTILWNGPLGVYELGPFGGGTLAAMQDMVEATKRGATTIIGGGDTGSASKYFLVGTKRVSEQVSWVSTGGGSSLVLMEGKELPAVTALSNIGDNSRPPAPDESKEPVDDDDD